MDIVRAAETFATWTQTHPQDFGEWETDYEEWPATYACARDLVGERPFTRWSDVEKASFLYLLARDNEVEDLADLLSEHPATLAGVAEHVCAAPESAEPDARWQIAAYLPAVGADAIPLLLTLLTDDDEYVRRRALLSLGALGVPAAEGCAVAAWESGLEYQRIAALHVLHQIESLESPQLERSTKPAPATG
ncbi:HEAT repeat domain-containing protein [Cellulosimicrobium sp. NPDC057862]|uniref:HEAT repeat domain-containing protein n=1 Tax=Cellulosimicrobium sp. NPDC057862 TaxID=3346266 RepID=UPI00366FB65A